MGEGRSRPVLPILVVGDGHALDSARSVLIEAGYPVRVATDDDLARVSSSPAWSLVVSGWTREGVDAPSVCKAIRASPHTAHVPVVVLGSDPESEPSDTIVSAGGDDVVTSGVPADLIASVEAAIRPSVDAGLRTRLETVIANIPGVVYRCELDESRTMWYLSNQVTELTGYPADDFAGNARRSFASIIHPDDRDPVRHAVTEAVSRGRSFEARYRVVTACGAVRHVLDRGRVVHEDRDSWLDGIVLDVTDRHDAETHRREHLTRQGASDERLRIAHDLHDSVSQTLYAAIGHARATELALERDGHADPHLLAKVSTTRALVQTALADIRGTVVELRPSDTDNLAAALSRHASNLESQWGTRISVHHPDELPDIDRITTDALVRIAREAALNAVRHADATSVDILLSADDHEVALEVRDDGRGFDPQAVPPGHFGITTMGERAQLMGGTLHLTSRPGAGTSVRIVVPSPRTALVGGTGRDS